METVDEIIQEDCVLASIRAVFSAERHQSMFSAQLTRASENLEEYEVNCWVVQQVDAPWRVVRREGDIVDDVSTFVANDTCLVPDSGPELVYMRCGPCIEVVVCEQTKAIERIDASEKTKSSSFLWIFRVV